jgi:hypothetical protein
MEPNKFSSDYAQVSSDEPTTLTIADLTVEQKYDLTTGRRLDERARDIDETKSNDGGGRKRGAATPAEERYNLETAQAVLRQINEMVDRHRVEVQQECEATGESVQAACDEFFAEWRRLIGRVEPDALRDHFAGLAMQGMLADSGRDPALNFLAAQSYRIADAMLAARTATDKNPDDCVPTLDHGQAPDRGES